MVPLLFSMSAGAGPWAPLGYDGFSESIDLLVGSSAVDCGFVNLLETPNAATRHRAYDCVRTALKNGQPFKFGTLRIPIDSYAYEVLARTPTGELWQITYDRMLVAEEGQQQWNRICKSARVDRRTLVMMAENCVSKPDGILKSS
jgi:hypothetical protein